MATYLNPVLSVSFYITCSNEISFCAINLFVFAAMKSLYNRIRNRLQMKLWNKKIAFRNILLWGGSIVFIMYSLNARVIFLPFIHILEGKVNNYRDRGWKRESCFLCFKREDGNILHAQITEWLLLDLDNLSSFFGISWTKSRLNLCIKIFRPSLLMHKKSDFPSFNQPPHPCNYWPVPNEVSFTIHSYNPYKFITFHLIYSVLGGWKWFFAVGMFCMWI